MSSNPQQDLAFFNWMNQAYHQKEAPQPHVYATPWTRPYTNAAAVSSSFHTIASNSPLISTPFLDSSTDEASSPACFSPYQTASPHLGQPTRYHHYRGYQQPDVAVGQYIDQHTTEGKGKPIFTGDPMDLLIDKSKAVNTSPALFATDDISTPLFGPILSSFDSGENGQHNQQEQSQHESGSLLHDHGLAMDWPCYNEKDYLFHALEGITESSTPASTLYYDLNNDKQHQHDSASPADDQKPSNQHQPAYSTTESYKEKKKTTEKGSDNKRRRKNSNASTYSSDGSETDHNKRRRKTGAKANDIEKRHGCPICRRKFSRRYNLHTHIQTHNKNRVKAFSCDVCGSKFDRKHDRDRHLDSVHHGKKSYECQVCNAAFCRRDALSRHSIKFHGEV